MAFGMVRAAVGMVAMFIHSAHSQQCTTVVNPDFDNEVWFAANVHFRYMDIQNWTTTGNVVSCRQGCPPWGGLHSNSGTYYVVLQGRTASITQTISVRQGQQYTIRFMSAERPGLGSSELLGVFAGGSQVLQFSPTDHFSWTEVNFTAASDSVDLSFVNLSPPGDQTVMVDAVSVCETPTLAPTPPPTTPAPTSPFTLDGLADRLATLEESVEAVTAYAESLETRLEDRINNIQRVIVEAVSNLPIPPPPNQRPSCGSAGSCIPSISATGRNVEISAPGGSVSWETGTCGTVDACDLVYALDTLRQLAV